MTQPVRFSVLLSVCALLPTRTRCICLHVILAALVGMFVQASVTVADEPKRQAWTSSRVTGSPEPPLPLSLVPAFPALKFQDPMHVRWQPDVQRYFVCELGGKVWSFPDDPQVAKADLAIDLKAALKSFDPEQSAGVENVYSIVFDPQFALNRYVYVCLVLKNKTSQPLPEGSRISRFHVTTDSPPTIDVDSELPIITWLGGGHNGCDLAFDNDGCLLFSTGDAESPSPPDRLATGQDISDLLASVLRIDVRGATAEQPYKIPRDNPFRTTPGARPEVWAYGFRNPWRMAVDPVTSQLWLGDVGWEKWELIHRVQRGGNYGWSVREGDELIQPLAPLGPTPILPTRVAISHADAASITGGFVYRGERLKAIQGEYLFGDWITGRIWSVPLDDHSPHHEVASDQLRIIAFAPDSQGEPLVVNHFNDTPLYRLTDNADYTQQLQAARNFPRLLSQTGLFANVAQHAYATGVRPFEISQAQWSDGAAAQHAIALPDLSQVRVTNEPMPVGAIAMFNSRLHYPAGTVLVKTLSMPAAPVGSRTTTPQSTAQTTAHPERRIETQLLYFDGRLWLGISYLWNEAQSDAELVAAKGLEIELPGGSGQRWRVHSRTECLQCHNPWPETTLAFTPEQLHRPAAGDSSAWLGLVREGYVITQDRQGKSIDPARCVRRPLRTRESLQGLEADGEADRNGAQLEERARAYLHANCAHCHQNGAGAAVDLSLKIGDAAKAMKAIDVAATKGNFGLRSNRLISPGDAAGSGLIFRMASSSIGRMPHIGSREVDFEGLATVADWIDSLSESSSPSAHRLSNAELETRARDVMARAATASSSEVAQVEGDNVLDEALSLALELARRRANTDSQAAQLSEEVIAGLAASPDPLVSSLFEAHVAAHQRQRRLGPGASYTEVADLTGDVAVGETLFFDGHRAQCAKCHRIGQRGTQVGPDLTEIGKRLSPAQLFEALTDPSRVVDTKYQSQILLLENGKVVTGLLSKETSEEVTLLNAQGESVTIGAADIETRRLDTKSLMPTGLTGGWTAQQAADLIAFLSSRK